MWERKPVAPILYGVIRLYLAPHWEDGNYERTLCTDREEVYSGPRVVSIFTGACHLSLGKSYANIHNHS